MPYWKITPHENKEYDYCVLPADTEADHLSALEYAQARLESLWDSSAWESGVKTVTIEIKEGEMPDLDEPDFDDGA